ncbi:hypothetical protein Fot_17056 [Forsythia ovata]|uniref:Uncharacterized protein n=1 Tax=Forsythia ovata TaxID=205694 RepID=A0ABD1VE85_9LAMI
MAFFIKAIKSYSINPFITFSTIPSIGRYGIKYVDQIYNPPGQMASDTGGEASSWGLSPYRKYVDQICPRGISELVRPEVTWGEIIRQHMLDFRVGQIFTEILRRSVLGVGMLALSLRSLSFGHIPRFTTRLVKKPPTQVRGFTFRTFP